MKVNKRHKERHKELALLLREERTKAGLNQADVGRRMGGLYQSLISHIECGKREVGLVEYLELASVIDFDPIQVIRKLMKVQP